MILLDTNVVIRIMNGEGRIGPAALDALDDGGELRCSAMVEWEVAMLAGKGRLRFEMPYDAWLDQAATTLGYAEVPVTGAIARDAGSLPGKLHGDPCDRIMIATARALGCPLLTTDRKILAYAAAGHLRAVDARR